jgi:hypothetical protein
MHELEREVCGRKGDQQDETKEPLSMLWRLDTKATAHRREKQQRNGNYADGCRANGVVDHLRRLLASRLDSIRLTRIRPKGLA